MTLPFDGWFPFNETFPDSLEREFSFLNKVCMLMKRFLFNDIMSCISYERYGSFQCDLSFLEVSLKRILLLMQF